MKKWMKGGLLVGSVLAAGAASASGGAVDISAATGAFDEAATAIGAVGAAMVVAAGAGIVYRWVTAFLVK